MPISTLTRKRSKPRWQPTKLVASPPAPPRAGQHIRRPKKNSGERFLTQRKLALGYGHLREEFASASTGKNLRAGRGSGRRRADRLRRGRKRRPQLPHAELRHAGRL